ncbi:MAG: DUF3857 and transglutaminase domain-containing protein [Candidatus Omnitrophica bacterium]|nr:DUF3857 and transglutaminase domain-containing protein [Candidatus Omnitrophota bacterium]
MKIKRLIFAILFLGFSGVCLAQPEVEQDSWEDRHSDESSLNTFSSYKVELRKNGSYTEDIHIIIKIQNEEAMGLGEMPIYYNKKYQTVKKIKAYIITPDGKRHKYEKIQDLSTSEEAYYSDKRKKIITMPKAVPGSVIDLQYQVFNKQGPIKGEYFYFQSLYSTVPIKHDIVTLIVPDAMEINFKYVNTEDRSQVTRKKGKVYYKWEFKDDDGYDEDYAKEDYTPPAIEIMPYVSISTMKDWPGISSWCWDEYSKKAVSNPEIKSEVEKITQDKNTPEEKITAISEYMYDNYRYVAMSIDGHNLVPHPADEIFNNKFGDCKDQSLLFITMLKAIDIQAYPVLVRSMGRGDPSGFLPNPGHFNHVIVAVDLGDKLLFVDPLLEGYLPSEISYDLEGSYVFIVDGKAGQFRQLAFMDLKQKTLVTESTVHLQADGSAVVEATVILDRSNSIYKRRWFRLVTDREMQDYLSYLENTTKGGKVIDFEVIGQEDKYDFLTIKLKTENPVYLKPMGNRMIFGSTALNLSGAFFLKERKYPVWLSGETKDITNTEYVIPEGFTFDYVPDDADFNSEWIDTEVRYIRNGRSIRQEKATHRKIATISPERYQEFKDFLREIENGLNESIIIKGADSKDETDS